MIRKFWRNIVNYYDLLGVGINANDDEIKKSYKKLAREYHPDKNNGDDIKFKDISVAYKTLINPEERKKYNDKNLFGNEFRKWGKVFGESSVAKNFYKKPDYIKPKGADNNESVWLSLEEFLKGCLKIIPIKVFQRCPSCDGTGAETFKTCNKCNGNGVVRVLKDEGKTIDIVGCNNCNGTGKSIEKKCGYL